MAWITCGGCQLKHTARPDGRCPRCGAGALAGDVAVDLGDLAAVAGPAPGAVPAPAAASAFPADAWARPPGPGAPPPHGGPPPYAPPAYTHGASPYRLDAAAAAAAPTGFPLGSRLAGAVLLLNALLTGGLAAADLAGDGGTRAWGAVAVDAVVGVLLLAGQEKVRGLAILRAAAGGLLFTGLAFARGGLDGAVSGLAQLAFTALLLMLLVGRPGPLRLAFSAAPLVAGLALVVASLGVTRGGVDVPGLVLALSGQATRGHVEEVRDEGLGWRLPLAGDRWHRYLPGSELRKGNPVVSEAVCDPDAQANVLVIAEALPDGADGFTPDLLVEAMKENAGRGYARFEPEEARVVPGSGGDGRVFHARFELDGKPAEGWFGGFVREGRVVQVIAVAPVSGLDEAGREELGALAVGVEL